MDSVNYTPPARRSMSDDELAIVLSQPHTDEASMLATMKLLEEQSALRAEDARLEAMWAIEMQVINTPESLQALNAFRTGGSAPTNQAHIEAPVAPVGSAPLSPYSDLGSVEAAPVAMPLEATPIAQTAEVAPLSQTTAEPLSLFEQIARAKELAAQSGEMPAQVEPAQLALNEPVVVPEPQAPVAQFPLVPVAPAPDISVTASAPSEPEPASDPFIEPVSVEQQITEFEEEREVNLDGFEAPSQTFYEHDEKPLSFDDIIEVAPLSASEYLDEARASVSTAHGPKTNQSASALFFNWLPIGGSVLPVILAVYIHSLGLALTDAVVAALLAIFAAFATTTAGAIAGKRAGLPTFVVSRATFGVFGARLPAAFFAALKLATASVMVLLLVIASKGAVAHWSVEGAGATRWQLAGFSVALWQIIIGAAVLLVAITSFIRLRYIKFLNLFVGVIASAGVIGALAYQLSKHGFDVHFYYLESWPKTLGAAAIVFAALGTVWSSSGADFASMLRQTTKGSRVIGWSSISLLILPSGIALATLILLETKPSTPELLGLSSIVPSAFKPYAYGVFAAVTLLLAAIELRSTRLAVRGLYTRWAGAKTQTVLALLFVAISLAGWHFYSSQGILYNLKDYALVLSVPVAAWLGIFAADSLVRRIAYHEISLTRSYGFYGNYNAINLIGWLLASALGLGMLSSDLTEFAWVGFLAKHAVNPDFWATSNLGIAAAFAVGVLFPLCFGVPRIKRQEAEVLSIESRRYELRDVLVTSEIEQLDASVVRNGSNL